MASSNFFLTLRHLAGCYQAFERFASRDIRRLGLTTGQFDIIATLGNTRGMTPKALCEQTLITKGTMTGVIDRLVSKGLLQRQRSPIDGRSQLISLTQDGQQLFEKIFPQHQQTLEQAFNRLDKKQHQEIDNALLTLKHIFNQH